jgi:hypothetical protein
MILVGALLAVALLSRGAVDGPPVIAAQAASSTYVGKVSGENAFIGVVSDGQSVVAYVCNSSNLVEWFSGSLSAASAGILELISGSGAKLSIEVASLNQTNLEGTTSSAPVGRLEIANGPSLEFSTGPSLETAGVFLADVKVGTKNVRAAWIALNDGDIRGGAFEREEGSTERRVFGLSPESLDLRTLTGTLPGIGQVEVVRVTADFFP